MPYARGVFAVAGRTGQRGSERREEEEEQGREAKARQGGQPGNGPEAKGPIGAADRLYLAQGLPRPVGECMSMARRHLVRRKQ